MPGPMIPSASDILTQAVRLGKQATAGAIETFGMGSKKPGDPRNATQIPIVEPAAAGFYQLGQLITDVLPTKDRLYIPAMEDSVKKQRLNSIEINRKLGIDDPSNAMEVIARLAPNLVGPNAELKAGLKGAEKLAQKEAVNAARAAKGPAAVVAGKAVDAAKAVGKGAVELAIPFNQAGAKGAVIGAGLAAGLSETADAFDNQKDYHSVADLVKPEKAFINPQAIKPAEAYMSPDVLSEYQNAVRVGDTATQDTILGAVFDAQQRDKVKALEPPPPSWETEKAQAIALVASGIGLAIGARALAKTKERLLSSSALTGEAAEPNNTNLASRFVQGFVQNDETLRVATKELTGDNKKDAAHLGFFGKNEEQKKWEAKFDAVSAPSLNSQFAHTANTGEIKNAATTTDPFGPLLSSIGKLTPDEQNLLADGLLAKTSLDDRAEFGRATSFKSHRDGHVIGDAELQQIADAVDNSPKLAPYAAAIRKQYRDMLDLMKEKGFLSQDQYDEWVRKRPNYVHMSKNVSDNPMDIFTTRGDPTRVPADARKGTMWARSTDEGGGVMGGEAANPIVELSSQWAKTLRQVAVQDVKKDWLGAASAHPVLKDVVKALAPGQTPNVDNSLVHTIWNNGMPQHYIIKDRYLAEALDFMPYVSQGTFSSIISAPTRWFEFGTTGAGAPQFAPVSAIYDTISGIVNRPKGYDLGLVSELNNKYLGGKLPVGGIDPTMWISAPVGALRLTWDNFNQAMASNLTEQLLTQNSWLYRNMGPDQLKDWRDRFAGLYANSIKASMEATGAANSSIFSSGSVNKLAPGLASVAPEFATSAAWQAAKDATVGDYTKVAQYLRVAGAFTNAGMESIRASSLARLYTSTLRTMHEGFRYQAYATNLPKVIGDEELTQLMASQTRRLAGDIAQAGGAEVAHRINQLGTYVNTGVQSLAQFGRMFQENPITQMANLSNVMISLSAMFLAYAAADPKNREKIRQMSDDELARVVPTFGGLPIVIPPEFRALIGPYIATLKDVTGLSSVNEDGTDNFDPSIGRAVQRYLDNGLTEEGSFSAENAFKDGLANISPVNPASFPVANAALAATTNLDMAFTRYTAKDSVDPKAIKSQEIDPLAGDGRFVGDAISAQWGKVIENLAGAHMFGYLRSAMDAQRALDGGASDKDAITIALSRVKDNWAKSSGPVSMLFPNYEKARSPNTTDFKLFYAKKEGYDQSIKILNDLIMTPASNGKDPATAMLSQLDNFDIQNNYELQGTQLQTIGMVANQIQSIIRSVDLDSRIAGYKKQIDDVNNSRSTTIEERNRKVNELNAERQAMIDQALNAYKVGEDVIRDSIGDPTFTWQKFAKDPKAYKQPIPSSAPSPEARPQ